jgi:hypothetical protein
MSAQHISLHRGEIPLGIVKRRREQVRERCEGHRGLGRAAGLAAWAAAAAAQVSSAFCGGGGWYWGDHD